jgi:D-tyrosyl-tRNA(Tyr) deacylase
VIGLRLAPAFRVVLQRILRAEVRVNEKTVASCGNGLLLLVGVGGREPQDPDAIDRLARKIFGLRIYEDEEGRMNRSLEEVGGEILVVPNFTLFGDTRKGRRPSWIEAAPPEVAEERVEDLCRALEALGATVHRSAFREHMEVDLVNDGPVTLVLEA